MELRQLMDEDGTPDGGPPGLPPWLWIGGLVLLVLGLLPVLLR